MNTEKITIKAADITDDREKQEALKTSFPKTMNKEQALANIMEKVLEVRAEFVGLLDDLDNHDAEDMEGYEERVNEVYDGLVNTIKTELG